MFFAEGAWRMRQKSAPSKKPERKKGRPKKRPKQQQKLLLAKLRTRPELPESWRKRRKKELRLSGTWQCFMLVLQFEKRWKEQPGPQHAESCAPAQLPPNGSGGACVHSASKCNISPRPTRTAEKGKTIGTKLPTNDDEQNYAAKRAISNSPMANSISSFSSFFSGAASGKLDGRCKMARKMKELVPASGMFPRQLVDFTRQHKPSTNRKRFQKSKERR